MTTTPTAPAPRGWLSRLRRPGFLRRVELTGPDHPTYRPWGQSALIDLHGCNHDALIEGDRLRDFLLAVVPAIDMTPHGSPIVGRFGEGDLEGWTGVQLIETSAITVHLDEVGDRAFIDVFSCKAFDPDIPVALALDYFGGEARMMGVLR